MHGSGLLQSVRYFTIVAMYFKRYCGLCWVLSLTTVWIRVAAWRCFLSLWPLVFSFAGFCSRFLHAQFYGRLLAQVDPHLVE